MREFPVVLFGALARKGISVVLITQASSEHSICIAVDPKQDEEATEVIEEEFSLEILAHQVDPLVLEKNLSIMAVVGDNMRHTPGISGRLFQALGNDGVNVVASRTRIVRAKYFCRHFRSR